MKKKKITKKSIIHKNTGSKKTGFWMRSSGRLTILAIVIAVVLVGSFVYMVSFNGGGITSTTGGTPQTGGSLTIPSGKLVEQRSILNGNFESTTRIARGWFDCCGYFIPSNWIVETGLNEPSGLVDWDSTKTKIVKESGGNKFLQLGTYSMYSNNYYETVGQVLNFAPLASTKIASFSIKATPRASAYLKISVTGYASDRLSYIPNSLVSRTFSASGNWKTFSGTFNILPGTAYLIIKIQGGVSIDNVSFNVPR